MLISDSILTLNESYRNYFLEREKQTIADYQRLNKFLLEKKCTFRGDPMPTLFKPNFISSKQQALLVRSVQLMSGILTRFIAHYMANPEIQNIMGFSEREIELFKIDPGYKNPLVISRMDAFLSGSQLQFLEFNCDSPAGIAYADLQEEGFQQLFDNYEFLNDYQISYMIRQHILLDSLLSCYQEFQINKRETLPEKPVIAIVDWEGVSTYSEFELHQHFFSSQGIDSVIATPQEFHSRDGKAFVSGMEVHLIYKRVITRELMEHWEEVKTFVESVEKGLVCCCNSFRSVIVGNKKVLAVLTDERFNKAFSSRERKLIRETVPWTAILADSKVSYHGTQVPLPDFVSKNKNQLVLKPSNKYGGKDVHIGLETTQSTWDSLIQRHLGDHSWVVQDYVTIPTEPYPEITDRVQFKPKYVNINPFAINGRYCGTITRVSDNQVINVSAGGGLVPTLTAEKIRPD